MTYPIQTDKEFTEGRKGGDRKNQKVTGNSSQINFEHGTYEDKIEQEGTYSLIDPGFEGGQKAKHEQQGETAIQGKASKNVEEAGIQYGNERNPPKSNGNESKN